MNREAVSTMQHEVLRDAANDVRAEHAPNEWDICVLCRKSWPCAAELLAEFATTHVLTEQADQLRAERIDAERLREAAEAAHGYFASVRAKVRALPTVTTPHPMARGDNEGWDEQTVVAVERAAVLYILEHSVSRSSERIDIDVLRAAIHAGAVNPDDCDGTCERAADIAAEYDRLASQTREEGT